MPNDIFDDIIISKINELDNYLINHELTIIQKEFHGINNSSFINAYNDIVYGSLLLTKNTFNSNSLIYYLYNDGDLVFFVPDDYQAEFLNVLKINYSKHQTFYLTNHVNSQELIILMLMLDLLIDDLASQIAKIQKKIDSIENKLINETKQKSINRQLLQIHKQTTKLRNKAHSIALIIDYFAFIKINPKNTYLIFIRNKSNRLEQGVKEIREYIIQIKELYQNSLDVSLNNSMNFFTIISAIFIPLTLITSWYGMNFDIPEFGFAYGYLIPIVISIILVITSIILIIKFKILRYYKD